jgi:hypothetical protein
MHWLPLLVVPAANVTFTPWRKLALAAIVIVAGGANNWMQFQRGVAFLQGAEAYARALPGAKPPSF